MSLIGVYDIFNTNWCGQTVWIYSDPHFDDPDLEKVIKRPNSMELVQKINEKVGRKDTIIFLGDISNIEYIRMIRGKKILIMGNHDAGASNYKRVKSQFIFDKDIYSKEEVRIRLMTHYPGWKITINETHDFHKPFSRWAAEADNCLFDEVYEGPLTIGEKIILSHEPVDASWALNIHGHVHDKVESDNQHFNVCADVIDYTPINLNRLLKSGGLLGKIETIHRQCINKAIKRKKKRG